MGTESGLIFKNMSSLANLKSQTKFEFAKQKVFAY